MKRNQTVYTCDYCEKEYIQHTDNYGSRVNGYMLNDMKSNREVYLCSGDCVSKYIDSQKVGYLLRSKKVDIPEEEVEFSMDPSVREEFCKVMANEICKVSKKDLVK